MCVGGWGMGWHNIINQPNKKGCILYNVHTHMWWIYYSVIRWRRSFYIINKCEKSFILIGENRVWCDVRVIVNCFEFSSPCAMILFNTLIYGIQIWVTQLFIVFAEFSTKLFYIFYNCKLLFIHFLIVCPFFLVYVIFSYILLKWDWHVCVCVWFAFSILNVPTFFVSAQNLIYHF